MHNFIQKVLDNMPSNWVKLTTHRLDIYQEDQAKTEFLEAFEELYKQGAASTAALEEMPTAYDYIRLGHPLSSVMEWAVAQLNDLTSAQVISFSSQTVPILAILRKNLLEGRTTRIVYADHLPTCFEADKARNVYGYNFNLLKVESVDTLEVFDGTTIYVAEQDTLCRTELPASVDFFVGIYVSLGSVLLVNSAAQNDHIADIQHVRRRETIAMTPADCLTALQRWTGMTVTAKKSDRAAQKVKVLTNIKAITNTPTTPLVGSSGLSVQYAIMMGLVQEALAQHPEKTIKFIVPPNCYGGTNDQARRVAACLESVEILDLPVDGDNDMVQSTEKVLAQVAREDAVPYIIAEIPTNPRVEVPDLEALKAVLSKARKTPNGSTAIDPVFILDQTFCPNVNFLGDDAILSTVRTISYASGSKFPSGGRCTAGYCAGNQKAAALMPSIEQHLHFCDNEATDLQLEILAEQLPSMLQRIEDAYQNTRTYVNFIKENLPTAKINFVSEELAAQGFTPSVFSLDLPTKGDTAEERESYKRELNNQLIQLMITKIPDESKYCVSYGQLKGCYWTIPATSTQGTTKEADKDYIARVSLSPNIDLELHKQVFLEFVKAI